MAIQVQDGLGVSTGTEHLPLMLQNGDLSDESRELSDISLELKALMKGLQLMGAQYSTGKLLDDIAARVRRLEMKRCQLASSRQITDLNDGADGNATSLVALADALGFRYMWSKGLSFVEQVLYALTAARKHLTRRIKNLGGEVEQQIEISNFIRSGVRYIPVGVHDNLSQLGYDLDSLNQLVSGMGVREFADNLFPEDGSVGSYNQPRRLTRYPRMVTRYPRMETRYPGVVTRRYTVKYSFLNETEDNAKSCNRNYNLH